jgi:hypothetical protein
LFCADEDGRAGDRVVLLHEGVVIEGINAAPGYELRVEEALGNFTIEWSEPGRFLLSRRHELFESDSLHPPFRRLGAFPTPLWKRAATLLRQGQRALRFMYWNVLPLADGSIFLTFGKSIGIYRDGKITTLAGLERPCRILRRGAALAADGSVYFGEYLLNRERGPMRVYRYTPGADRVEIVHVFPANTVRHIHGIFADPYEGGLWCLTGDVGDECRIMRTMDGFRTIEIVGSGDESWRSVSMLFSPTAIYYAMDAEFTQNYLYRLDRKSGERTVLAEVDGPVYYSQSYGDQYFFAVTAELCPSQKGRAAELWRFVEDGAPERVATLEKDRYSVRYFMPGTIDFPRGPGESDRVLFRATALAGDNRMFSLKR